MNQNQVHYFTEPIWKTRKRTNYFFAWSIHALRAPKGGKLEAHYKPFKSHQCTQLYRPGIFPRIIEQVH